MKIKLEWDYDNGWEVEALDLPVAEELRLTRKELQGEYISVDEYESLRAAFGKAMQLISDLDALLYDDLESEAYKRIEKFLEGRDE